MKNVFVVGLFSDRVLKAYDETIIKELDLTTVKVVNFEEVRNYNFVEELIVEFNEENKAKDLTFDDLHVDEQVEMIIEQTRESDEGFVKYLAKEKLAKEYANMRIKNQLELVKNYTCYTDSKVNVQCRADDEVEYKFEGGKILKDRVYKKGNRLYYVIDPNTLRSYSLAEMFVMLEDDIREEVEKMELTLLDYNTEIIEMLIECINKDLTDDLEIYDLKEEVLYDIIIRLLNTLDNLNKYRFMPTVEIKRKSEWLQNQFIDYVYFNTKFEYTGMVEHEDYKNKMIELWELKEI